MNEIEKLYKNARVKKYRLLDKGNKLRWVYPKFTAEKQLELIVFFVRKGFKVSFDNYTGDFSLEGIQESLAMAINDKWQSLTEEEKEQIKEILSE